MDTTRPNSGPGSAGVMGDRYRRVGARVAEAGQKNHPCEALVAREGIQFGDGFARAFRGEIGLIGDVSPGDAIQRIRPSPGARPVEGRRGGARNQARGGAALLQKGIDATTGLAGAAYDQSSSGLGQNRKSTRLKSSN